MTPSLRAGGLFVFGGVLAVGALLFAPEFWASSWLSSCGLILLGLCLDPKAPARDPAIRMLKEAIPRTVMEEFDRLAKHPPP